MQGALGEVATAAVAATGAEASAGTALKGGALVSLSLAASTEKIEADWRWMVAALTALGLTVALTAESAGVVYVAPVAGVVAALAGTVAASVSGRTLAGWTELPAYVVGGSLVVGAVWLASPSGGVVAPVFLASTTAAAVHSLERGPSSTTASGALAAAAAVSAPVAGTATYVFVSAVVCASLGAAAERLDVMTRSGAAGGALLSFVLLVWGGPAWFLLLGGFVLVGALATRYGEDVKRELPGFDGSRRSISNVFANGGVALVATSGYALSVDLGWQALFAAVFAGSLATAAADTLSSEIGMVHGRPRLITTLEAVEPGEDGGVSLVGELAVVVAALVFAAAAVVLGVVDVPGGVAVLSGGLVGAHLDSFLGATLEGRLLGNESVNLLSCLSGGLTSGLLVLLV